MNCILVFQWSGRSFALNTGIDASTLALALEQLEAKLIFVDYQFTDVALKALELLSLKNVNPPQLVVIPNGDKSTSSMDQKHLLRNLNYNGLLEMGRDDFTIIRPNNECDPISVNYTSMDMFRCNGWCLTWSMAAVGATNIRLRNVSAEIIFDAISLHKLGPFPNPEILTKVEGLGFSVYHGYGMTEVLGPSIVRPWKPELDSNFGGEKEKIKNREGVHNLLIEGADVKDPNTMESVPNDGKTIGEVMFRSNILMSWYPKNSEITQKAFRGGWYHTRDLGVRHPNGYIEMKDRAKDIIMSGERL
ncbi:unnamed protein product [Dovyalis caffra]|uniref:AMP-dependent synthetase/ligase domain-containing protein n=1 Tax=Dovyalis caffra TaxID=77055 RepID=A0AAV1SSQ8_9ROSI|nr:unnamed protein product [Dovyalis caffra]